MKRITAFILAALLILTLTACGQQEAEAGTVGGWTLTEDGVVSKEAQDAFEKAMDGFVGVNYTPVALLGKQLVSGVNYCFLCEATVVYPGARPYYAVVTVYEDTQGKAEIKSVVAMDLGRILESGRIEDSQPDSSQIMGGWEVDRDSVLEVPDGVLHLATQVVSGTNHCVLCKGWKLCFAAVTVQKTEITKTVLLDIAELSQGKALEPVQELGDWTRQGYFQDENKNMLSVTWMDDVDEPGWYVACMLGEDLIEDSYGGMLSLEGNTLHGSLSSSGEKDDLTVTVSEEGEDGLLLAVEGGETLRFSPMEMEEPFATLWVNTDGWGVFTCVEEGQEPDGSSCSSLQYGLAGPETYVLTAIPGEDWVFVKWTLNGEDYSTDEQITVEITENADFVAVFEFPGDEAASDPV